MPIYINKDQTQLTFKTESTAGTYDAPQAADNDIRLHFDGMISNESTKNMIGKLGDGTHRDGRHYSGERILKLPDIQVEMVKASAPTTSPKWIKLAEPSGYTEYTESGTNNKGIRWSGQTSCKTLSCLVEGYECGTLPEGQAHQLRGIVGNMEIKAEGGQAPFVLAFSELRGAWLGPSDRASAAINPLVGNDTAIAEMIGDYSFTIGSHSTEVWAYSFNPNNSVAFIPGTNDEGITKFHVQSMGARLTVTVPLDKVVTKDYIDAYFSNIIEATVALTGDADAGYNMTHNNCEYVECQYSEVNGAEALEISFNVLEDAIWVQK